MTTLRPADAAELSGVIQDAAAARRPLEVVAGGTRRHVGRPVEAEAILDVSGLTGVVDYDPTELVLTARPGTPLAEIEALLAAEGQMLAFEPPRSGPASTLGGAIAAGASGPRRPFAGAARDHLLGFAAVSGKGEAFKAGGRVTKNVTGFDLSKLMAGSWGTLAVITEVSVKVLPAPRTETSLRLAGLDARAALAAMAAACGSPAGVSAAARLPTGETLLRLEGFQASVAPRLERLRGLLAAHAQEVLGPDDSRNAWRRIRDLDVLPSDAPVLWRIAGLGDRTALPILDAALVDWAGQLVWTTEPDLPQGLAGANLWRGPAELRARRGGAQADPVAARLAAELKRVFDPADILNRGRLHPALAPA